MGSVWLNDLDKAVASCGVDWKVFDNYWRTRSRSSGGYDQLLAIGGHHDASKTTTSDAGAENYGWLSHPYKPVGAIRIRRDTGLVVIGAAGATNTMGVGGPVKCSKGTVPKDAGNRYMLAIEAGNNGIGEPWSQRLIDAYLALVAGLCKWYGLSINDYYGHYGYCLPSCPGRKIDPAGPTPWHPALGGITATGGAKIWQDSNFRSLAAGVKPPQPEPPQPKPPDPPPTATTPPLGVAREMYLIMKYGGTPDANWSGYYSDGNKRYSVMGMDHAARLVRCGAKDAKTNAVVTSTSWSGVSHTTSSTELTKYCGSA